LPPLAQPLFGFGGNTSCVELTTDKQDLGGVRLCGTGAHPLAAHLMRQGKPVTANHTYWDTRTGITFRDFPFFSPAFIKGNTGRDPRSRGQWHLAARRTRGPDGIHVFPRRAKSAARGHQLPRFDRGYSRHRWSAGGDAIPASSGRDPGVPHRGRRCRRGLSWWITSHSPTSYGARARHPGTLTPSCMRATAVMPNSWPTPTSSSTTPNIPPKNTVRRKTWGHSTYEYAVQLAAAAGVKRLALTHHDPSHDDAFVAEIETTGPVNWRHGSRPNLEVFCAYEGCEIVLQAREALNIPCIGRHELRCSWRRTQALS
jgi:hypothetical protein